LETEKVKKAIRVMVPGQYLEDFSVGLSGSMALTMKVHETPDEFNSAMVDWSPSDVDIFVCSKHCERVGEMDGFTNFVFNCLNRLKEAGYVASNLAMWKHNYIHENKETLVADFSVRDIAYKFSFIECSGHATVFNVVKGFDFDAVQAIYDFQHNKVCLDPIVEEKLKIGSIRVSPWLRHIVRQIENDTFRPSHTTIWKLKATLGRMRKYESRGMMVRRASLWRQRLQEIVERDWGSNDEESI